MNSHIYNLQERTECTKTEPKLRLWIVNYEIDKAARGIVVVKAKNASDVSDIVLSNSQFNSLRDKFNIIRIEEIINDGAYADLISEEYLIYHVTGILPDKTQSDWEEKDAFIKNKPEIPSKTSQLENDSLFLSNILDESITESKLDNGAVSSSKIKDGAVTEDKLSEEVKEKLNQQSGGYEPPVGGIPKADLSEEVQSSLGKADTALQEHQDISGKQDVLIPGDNIKTINGETILGSGNINIEGSGTSLIEVTSNPKEVPTDNTIAINTSNGKVFFGISNKGWWFITAKMLSSAEITGDTLSIQAEYDNGTISVSGEVKDGILIL